MARNSLAFDAKAIKKQIRRLHKRRMTDQEMADETGCSRDTIYKYRKQLGLCAHIIKKRRHRSEDMFIDCMPRQIAPWPEGVRFI